MSGRSESSAVGDDVAVTSGGSGAVVDEREAIRARDKRERDLAVQQRRSMDSNKGKGKGKTSKGSDAREANHQKHQQREGQDRKETEKVCTVWKMEFGCRLLVMVIAG